MTPEVIVVGQPVPPEKKKLLEPLGEGAMFELLPDGSYLFYIGLSDMNSAEKEAFSKGKIVTRIIEADKEDDLPGPAFMSLFHFGPVGPFEIIFNPALYARDKWKELSEKSSSVNTIVFHGYDRKTWKWTNLRFATMPNMWRKHLVRWWDFLAKNSDIDRERYISAFNRWTGKVGSVELEDLWERAVYTGSFGEPLR